jgi:hypothetical protein
MPVRERSWARAALSRLPRWVTALGIATLVAELTGAAVLLTAGPSRVVTWLHGTQTVVLRVDGVGVMNAQCAPPGSCGPDVTYATPAGSRTYRGTRLPFTSTVQVPAGGVVTLNVSSEVDTPVTCSIAADGRVLSGATTYGDRSSGGLSTANCHGTIPSVAAVPSATTRTVILRVDGGSGCPDPSQSCGPQVYYRTPTGGVVHWSTVVPFVQTVEVQSGGIVTIDAIADATSANKHWATCTITVNDNVISEVTTHKYLGQAICQSVIP